MRLALLFVLHLSLIAQKYPAGSAAESTGGEQSCVKRCAAGPMKILPELAEACAEQPVKLKVRIEGDLMTTAGDPQLKAGGTFDWGDGQSDPLNGFACCTWEVKHLYTKPGTYRSSATFSEEHVNEKTPPGFCSYRCGMQQASVVTIYAKTDVKCGSGVFNPLATAKISTGKSIGGSGAKNVPSAAGKSTKK